MQSPENPTTLSAAQQQTIRAAVTVIAASPMFRGSSRRRRFLGYIVEETLQGCGAQVNGYALWIEVFDRSSDFDPTTDAIVRVEAGRLRSKLVEYYGDHGAQDLIQIGLPRDTTYQSSASARQAIGSSRRSRPS